MSEPIRVEMKEGVEPTPESQKQEPKQEVKQEPRYVRIEDLEKVNQAINNTREYNNRQLSEIKAEIAKLAPKPVQTGDPDLDELVQRDWKGAVAKISEDVISRYEARKSAESESERITRILNESKERVMERHKELSDPESDKAKVFMKVLEENPDFRTNPRGPLLAAYEMENRLKTHDTVKDEDQRVTNHGKDARAKAASVPHGTSPGAKTVYSLTKADMDFCRLNGINPENYKRYRGAKEARA